MNGQKSESTVYVKGQRKRTESGGFMGMGGDVADVEQCDLKQNLKISDKKKMYTVEPFDTGSTDAPDVKKPGTIRIGVLPPTNRGGESISITNMQTFLAQKLTTGNVEGVAVGSEADARSAGCDYLLTSDFSKLKQSTAAKIGGMFGKITNTGVNGSYDTQVDYTLTSLKSGQVKLQNKAVSKTETNVDRAAESVLEIEAGAVVIAGMKN